MASNLNETWQNVMKLLEAEMTSVSFSTWIETLIPLSINNNCLVLEVPSDYNLGLIKSRYYDLIKTLLNM